MALSFQIVLSHVLMRAVTNTTYISINQIFISKEDMRVMLLKNKWRSNPASLMNNPHIIGSPPHVATDETTSVNQSPVKGSDPSYSGQQIPSRGTGFSRGTVMSCLHQLL
jgi:hypothetical protein